MSHVRPLAAAALATAALAIPAGAQAAPASANPVVSWNRTLLTILRTPGAQPATVHSTRNMAIVHLAMWRAVSQARGGTSAAAALDAAARGTLDALYPAQQPTVDNVYGVLLGRVPAGPAKDAGVTLGASVASALVAERADDGSAATPPPYVPTGAPGDFTPTPPAFPTPVFTHWSMVRPFVLQSASQFEPAPPPALDSAAYADALNEAESLGSATSTTRTAEQTEIARFWSGSIQNLWNEIAQTAVLGHRTGLRRSARLFAVLDESLADSSIAMYEAKYRYRLWRPITAIQEADLDGNPATIADPAFTPLLTTPADPSYPGAHSVISSDAATVLQAFYGNRFRFSVASDVLPGVSRSFATFTAAAREAGLSRIYAGVHTRLDHESGAQLGGDVAGYELQAAGLTG